MTDAPAPGIPLLSVRDLVKHYPRRDRRRTLRGESGVVHSVCGISFDLFAGETLGLVGESGCGKTTTSRTVLNLQHPTSGDILFQGRSILRRSRGDMRMLRRQMQIVFQDPYASLDPRATVRAAIAEPLRIHHSYADGGADRVDDLLRAVGLDPAHGNRYPHQFSGGQRQRVGIARALALDPNVIVLDEPVSALDVSIQAGVVNLLQDLQDRLGLSYLFVAHDLSVVRHLANRVAVMYLGQIVEIADCDALFDSPAHPYTQTLISAIPLPDPRRERTRKRITVSGDLPSPSDPPSGCRFRTRCPTFAGLSAQERDLCVHERPELTDRGHGHPAACHFAQVVRVI